jgi:hypothetical protein
MTGMTDLTQTDAPDVMFHEHRRPHPSDFEGKRITLFECDCDNTWRIWFDDGTAFAIQCDTASDGIAFMELCDECVERPEECPT